MKLCCPGVWVRTHVRAYVRLVALLNLLYPKTTGISLSNTINDQRYCRRIFRRLREGRGFAIAFLPICHRIATESVDLSEAAGLADSSLTDGGLGSSKTYNNLSEQFLRKAAKRYG